jgi:hypothetical protein
MLVIYKLIIDLHIITLCFNNACLNNYDIGLLYHYGFKYIVFMYFKLHFIFIPVNNEHFV